MANISQGQLRAMINQMVEQAVGEKMGARAASWQSDQRRIQAGLSYNEPKSKTYGDGFDFYGAGRAISGIAGILQAQKNIGKEKSFASRFFGDNKPTGFDRAQSFGSGLQGIGGLQSAYQNKDPLGGAMAGYQTLHGFGSALGATGGFLKNLGWAGMALGFLTGLFGKKKEINEWNRPKFKDAEQAYNKLFTVDRGERDLYHMPESFYFRDGWSGPRHIVVKVGNEQFNDHIRESMTSSYSNQLQRGLVF